MKNIYCIVGPSGCGKTTITEALEKQYGYKTIESYTTRPPRYEGETGHIFVTPEEFKALGKMCAYTKFDGHEYGVTADLVDQNDLYVIDPAGLKFFRNNYTGNKNIKVIGITANISVLIERMKQRGDSDEKIIKRLVNDAEAFKDLNNIADVVWGSDDRTIEALCNGIHYEIENFEYWAKHDFSLLDEKGEVVKNSEHRFYTLDEAIEGLKDVYPEGLPEGWVVRDDTEVAREKYLKAIKKLKPSFKSSMITVNMENAGTSQDGYTAVAFTYKGKEYFYRACSHSGEEWITEKERSLSPLSAVERLSQDIDWLQKQIDTIDQKLRGEHIFSAFAEPVKLEATKVRFKQAIDFLGKALVVANSQVIGNKQDNKQNLDAVIEKVKKEQAAMPVRKNENANDKFR